MELQFQPNTIEYLRRMTSRTANQEEVAEAVVPDALPDISRIVDRFGTVILRSKELRSGGCTVSGGVQAGIIYVPEGEGTPQQMEVYMPFTMKWDFDMPGTEGTLLLDCGIKSIDARMLNPRKIMMRVNLACDITVYEPSEETFYEAEDHDDVEMLQVTYPFSLPMALEEKVFQLEEELELPAGQKPVFKIYKTQMYPVISDGKVVGDKAVLKGNANVHILYLADDETLNTWDFEVPFSQLCQLGKEMEDGDLSTTMLVTGMELDKTDEEGKRMLLKAGLVTQCLVMGTCRANLVSDAYSLSHEITPQTTAYELESRLDHCQTGIPVREFVDGEVDQVVDVNIWMDHPQLSGTGDACMLQAPVVTDILYFDRNGMLQTKTNRSQLEVPARMNCKCSCCGKCVRSSPITAMASGSGAEVRYTADMIADISLQDRYSAITGMDVGEARERDPMRPSLIVRTIPDEEDLWTVAKACGSTKRAIGEANDLQDETVPAGKLLLIPVL